MKELAVLFFKEHSVFKELGEEACCTFFKKRTPISFVGTCLSARWGWVGGSISGHLGLIGPEIAGTCEKWAKNIQ